jgi:hypothetical protein
MPSRTMPQAPTARRSNPPHRSYKHIAIIFVVLAVLLVLGVTYLALSKVTITLTPSDQQISHNFTLTLADTEATSTSLTLPAKIFSNTTEVSQDFSVEEGKQVNAQAQGSVTLYNERNQAQTLVATTRLLTPDNVLFRLSDSVTIPANSEIQAQVAADQEGPNGNIPPSSFTIPGLSPALQELVYAKSTATMTGGTRQIGILTTKDIERGQDELIKNNSSQLLTKFIDQLEDKDLTLVDTQTTLEDLSYNQELGEEVDLFTLSADLTVTAVFAQRDQILSIAKTKLEESQGPKAEFVNADPSSLKYELLEVDLDNNQVKVKVEISGLTTFDAGQDIFDKNLLVGFTEDDLKLYFSQFKSIQDVEVEFSPFWVKKVPILKDHIEIKLK